MTKEKIELMIEGGKAAPNAAISQKLGPLGINIMNVINSINDKTIHFDGMKIPVKVIVDTKTKSLDYEIGTPPTSELIKKEFTLEKGSPMPDKEKVANASIEQVIKIALMKKDNMLVNNLKSAVKNVVGSCNSLGILVEGKIGKEINKDIDAGKYDKEINSELIEISEEKKTQLKKQLEDVMKEIKRELEKEKALAERLVEKKEVKEETVIAKEGEGAPAATTGKAPIGKEAGKEAPVAGAKETGKAPAKEFEKKGKK